MAKPDAPIAINDRTGVVLLSGGLDSCVVMALSVAYGWRIEPVWVDYEQQTRAAEFDAARRISEFYGTELRTMKIRGIPISPLTGGERPPVLTLDELRDQDRSDYIVPARNPMLLALGLSVAQSSKARGLFFGATLEDAAAFPDCRQDPFVNAFEKMARAADESQIMVKAPLSMSRKVDVVRIGKNLGAPLDLSVSCYHATPESTACHRCPACMIREEAFEQA